MVILQSDQPDAFDTAEREFAGVLVGRDGNGPGNAQARRELDTALATRNVINQGTGIVMARHGLTAVQAVELMTRRAGNNGMTMEEVVEQVTSARDL